MEWQLRELSRFTETEYARCLALMTPERRQKMEALRHEERRKTSVLGEWMVKNAIAARCGIPMETITLARSEKGKPYAKDLPVHFNISHAGPLVAIALADRPIGIDIERLRPIDLKLARRVCTEEELAECFPEPTNFAPTGDPELILRFFRIWTAKEAYFKCIGTGITDLRTVSYPTLRPGLTEVLEKDYIIQIYQEPR